MVAPLLAVAAALALAGKKLASRTMTKAVTRQVAKAKSKTFHLGPNAPVSEAPGPSGRAIDKMARQTDRAIETDRAIGQKNFDPHYSQHPDNAPSKIYNKIGGKKRQIENIKAAGKETKETRGDW